MTAKDLIGSVVFKKKFSYSNVAEMLGISRSTASRKIMDGTIRLDEFIELMDKSGVEIVLVDKADGAAIPKRKKEHGRRLIGMSKGVAYDTKHSYPLAYNGRLELFIDSEKRYFFADYIRKKVNAADDDVAIPFLEKYGEGVQ